MSDELKSALDLALEKLDKEMGAAPKLTGEQKDTISDIRSRFKSKIAEVEIAAQSTIREALQKGDMSVAESAKANMIDEKRRLEEKMEREVAKVREGSG